MSPIEQYNSIIYFRQQYPLVKGERHHIIPKSCGGCNKRWNIVRLTSEEHIECHRLLTLIYPTGEEHKKMLYAWRFMALSRDGCSEEDCAKARQLQHELQIGKPSGMAGKHHSEETKRKMSWAHKGQVHPPVTDAARQKMIEKKLGGTPWNKGRTGIYTEETRHKMGESSRKRKGIPTGIAPWNKGCHLTEEDKQKKREAALRRWAKVKG